MDNRIDDLIALLRADDYEAGKAASAQLAALGADAVAPLIDLLREYRTFDDYEARLNSYFLAEDALIGIGAPAIEPLIAALNDEAWGARAAAVWVLGKLGDVRAVQPLIKALRWDDAGSEVVDALISFGEIVLRPAIFALRNHEDAHVRRGAAYVIGEFADPMVVPALLEALEQETDEETRLNAIAALGRRQDARAVEPLIAALRDVSPAVREAATRALGEIGVVVGGERISGALGKALSDGDWGTRQSAAEMLLRLGGGEAQAQAEALLLGDLQDADVEIRLGAAWSLASLRDERALDPLVRLLYYHENRIVSAAALGLGELGDQRAVVPLTAARKHVDEGVREAARSALRRLGHSD